MPDNATTFAEFERDVLRYGFACGYSGRDYAAQRKNPKQTQKVIAAAVCVIEKRGPRWCVENPAQFQRETLQYLTWSGQIVLFVIGLFSGGSTWLILARFIVPVIADLLRERYLSRGVFGSVADDWCELARESQTILKG